MLEQLRDQIILGLVALDKPVTFQDIDNVFLGRVIMSLTKLRKVRSKGLLNLSSGLVHLIANLCSSVSTITTRPMEEEGFLPRVSCSQTFAFIPTP